MIYRYQIRVILQYSRSTPSRLVRNAVSADGWKALVDDIEKENRQISEALELQTHSKEMQVWRDMEEHIEKKTKEIKELQKATLASAVVSY